MAQDLNNKYYVKNTSTGTFTDVTTKWDGLNILSISDMSALGKAVNVYNEQWINSNVEDFLITSANGKIIRENIDITITFIIGPRYASNATGFNTQAKYDEFVSYMTDTDVWVRSMYYGKDVHCVALDNVQPKEVKLHRGTETYILGEITLHTLAKPTNI